MIASAEQAVVLWRQYLKAHEGRLAPARIHHILRRESRNDDENPDEASERFADLREFRRLMSIARNEGVGASVQAFQRMFPHAPPSAQREQELRHRAAIEARWKEAEMLPAQTSDAR